MLIMKDVSKTFNPGTVNEKCALRNLNLELAGWRFCNDYRKQWSRKIDVVQCNHTGAFFIDRGLIVLDGEDITYQKGTCAEQGDWSFVSGSFKGNGTAYDDRGKYGTGLSSRENLKNAYFSRIKAADKAKIQGAPCTA